MQSARGAEVEALRKMAMVDVSDLVRAGRPRRPHNTRLDTRSRAPRGTCAGLTRCMFRRP